MTDTTQTTASKKPVFTAHQATERENAKTIYNRVGAAWNHTKGNGLTLLLHSVPLDGKIVLFPYSEKQE